MSKSLQKIFEAISVNIRDPFVVIDGSGEILYSNKQAKRLFNLLEKPGSILDYLEDDCKFNFDELLEKLAEKNEPVNVEHFDLQIKSGSKIKSRLILNPYEQANKFYVLCTFIPRNIVAGFTDKTTIKDKLIDKEKIISDSGVRTVIEKVESLFPLTLIGKEIVHKLVDDWDRFFWIVDDKGECILANEYLASSLGLKPFQIEGKSFDEFVPGYMKEFYHSVQDHIRHTLNTIVLDGFPFREITELKDEEIVEVPLVDNENNLVAIIGVSQSKGVSGLDEESKELVDILYKIIDYFPKAAAFITTEGIIKLFNEEFSRLFRDKSIDLNGLNFEEILPESFVKEVRKFLNSSGNRKELYLNKFLAVENLGKREYQVFLNKHFDDENQLTGLSVIIEKINFEDSLQQLIKSRGRMFEFLIQNNPEPIYIYDKETLRFLEVNQAALKLYGYSRDEFLQTDLTDLYTPEDIQTLLGSSSEQPAEGKFSKPFRQKRKDGSTVFVEISKMSFKYNDKDAHFNIVKDVTDRLELEKKNQLFKVAFDNTEDLLFVTDADGIITFVNASVAQFLQSSKEELKNSSLASLVKDDDRITITTTIFQSHLNEPTTVNVEFKTPGGKLVPVELTAVPIINFEGKIDSFTIIGKLEKGEVQEKVREVVKEVIVEKPGSSSGAGLDTTFLSNVFHEILTPMNVILGFAQELTDGIEKLSPEQQEAVDIINQNRAKLLSTMNSIIEYSEIQKQKDEWDIKEYSITEIVEDLSRDIYEITGTREIEFAYGRISSSLKFETDKQKFDAFINNLIRLVSRLCKENKIYFSAYPVDSEDFLLMISDGFAAASSGLASTLRKLFVEEVDPKELGISKLGAHITIALLNLLKGKFVSSESEPGKYECGFVFPIKIKAPVTAEPVIEEQPPVPETKEEVVKEGTPPAAEVPKEEPPVQQEAPAQEEPPKYQPVQSFEEQPEEPGEQEDYGIEIEEEQEVTPSAFTQPAETEEKTMPANEPLAEAEVQPEAVVQQPVEPVAEKPPVSSEDELDLSNLTCLYIEDQVDSQILFKVQMRGLKDIKYAVSFEEALPLLEQEQFDFIVMDINLQGEYNGLDALKIIHKMPAYQDVPIIAVTAYVLPGDREKFIAAGFNDFISKPIFREKMLESLKKIFLQKA